MSPTKRFRYIASFMEYPCCSMLTPGPLIQSSATRLLCGVTKAAAQNRGAHSAHFYKGREPERGNSLLAAGDFKEACAMAS